MKTQIYLCTTFLIFITCHFHAFSQPKIDLNIQHQSDIASTCFEMVMTMKYDALDRPYLYIANKEGGLKIYNVTTLSTPVLTATIPVALLDGLHVMNLEQSGTSLYLALGNHFTNSQSSGMAIIDINTPSAPSVKGMWRIAAPDGGAGIVKVDGNYAYLGAMKNGLIILDVTNPAAITQVSQFLPDINYPTPNPNANLYNARGMEVRGDVLYLCFDAGGLRIINVSNKAAPVETGHYSNPVLNGLPRAYNNIVINDHYAYIAVDYCGLEVLDIADTSNISLAGWWNPYNCPGNNWFSSPVHANELAINSDCDLLFIATAKSDMHVVDISNPMAPDSVDIYGGASNDIGTWGVSAHKNKLFLSYICAVIPFTSNWTGVKILTYDIECASDVPTHVPDHVGTFVTTLGNRLTIHFDTETIPRDNTPVSISNILGQTFTTSLLESHPLKKIVDITDLPDGLYILHVQSGRGSVARKFVRAGR